MATRRLYSTRQAQVLAGIFIVISIILASLFVFVTPAKASIKNCQPGEVCTFNMASASSPCGINERHFFEDFGDNWEFSPQSEDNLSHKFGKFASADKYVKTYRKDGSYIYGGCICDTASWINYVAKINGFKSYALHMGADIYTVPQVPTGYSVTICIECGGPDQDLQLINDSDQTMQVKWIVDNSNSTVSIWVEKGGVALEPTPASTLETPVLPDPSIQTEASLTSPDFAETTSALTTSFKMPRAEITSIAKYLLIGVLVVCLLAFIFSPKFRKGMLTALVFLIIVGVVALVIFVILHP